MPKPRVFISSTFYDLKYVREDIERFVKDLGYEPVRHETGSIAYGKDKPIESYAIKEVELCNIIVSIIGGRFGSESKEDSKYSISQMELRNAIEKGIQVFIFIEKNVHSEFRTYRANKTKKIKYVYVDDKRIYEFIESLYKLDTNNPISSFETSNDIVEHLRSQWAGLFQRYLQFHKRQSEIKVLGEMKAVSRTLNSLLKFFKEEKKDKQSALTNILKANHPAFHRFAELTDTEYRVYFSNLNELNTWLNAKGWKVVPKSKSSRSSIYQWENKLDSLILREKIFDENGELKTYSNEEWNDEWIKIRSVEDNPY